MIVRVNEKNLDDAAEVHSQSWIDAHKWFCTPQFIQEHTFIHQKKFLEDEIKNGKDLFMLIKKEPVGVVSVKENLIENLYIKPSEQRKGYGTELLNFAINKCVGTPTLWILDNNKGAFKLYSKHGFIKTGNKNKLAENLYELEMKKAI